MSPARFLWMTAPGYLALLWVVSSVFLTHGFTCFALGLVPFLGALVAYRLGQVKPLFLCYLGMFLAAATVGGLELLLHLAPDLLTGRAALHTFGGYHAHPDGIYQYDRHLGYTLRPGCSRRLYWNGHWWYHDTNRDGYRGPRVGRADVVFLGDSMIYGHGVETDEAVPARFAAATGLSVANLGQQGACLLQMEMRFRRLAGTLRPRHVFVCSHFNDITDATYWYPSAELKRYLAEEEYRPTARRRFWPRDSGDPREWWRRNVQVRLNSIYLVDYLLYLAKKVLPNGGPPSGGSAEGAPLASPRDLRDGPFAPWAEEAAVADRLGWAVHRRSLRKIQKLCEERGARLVLFDLGFPGAFSAAIEAQAKEMGVPYVPAGQAALNAALAGEETFLPNDGHWNPRGCDLVSRELIRTLRNKP